MNTYDPDRPCPKCGTRHTTTEWRADRRREAALRIERNNAEADRYDRYREELGRWREREAGRKKPDPHDPMPPWPSISPSLLHTPRWFENITLDEHMERTCQHCGHRWAEAPVDAAKRTRRTA